MYNGDKLSYMKCGNIRMYFIYDAGGTPIAVRRNSVNYYYVTNIQGDVTAILNYTGTPVVEYTYDAWGNLISTTGSMAASLGVQNPLRYRGYLYDREYGLYYLQSRYYNPGVGRFLNADALASTGQGLLGNNMFAYCNNNPVMHFDPKGTELVLDKRIMFGVPGGGADVTSIFILAIEALIGTITKPDTEKQDNSIAITDTQTKKSDSDTIFTLNPYDFNPNGLKMHVCVEPGTGSNGGIIKWEVPGTKIAVFEWNEDWDYGAHYHTLKIEWKNKHYGPHHPIGSEVPEPWQSTYF